MSVNYSIGQSVVETSAQRIGSLAPRNPAEELIFQRADVVKMIETSDGSIHYFDETGNPVAVMNVDGSVYLWDDGGWQSYSIDDVMAVVSYENSPAPVAESKSVDPEDDVEYAAMACQSTTEVFSEDSMMSIDPEDLYCDAETKQCHMPDEGRATERHAKRFADSAPTSGSTSGSGSSGAASAKKADADTEPQTVAAKKEDSDEVETIDYTDAGLSGGVEGEDIDDFAVGFTEEPVDLPEDVAQAPVVECESSHEAGIISGGESSPVDLSAAIYTPNAEMPISDVSVTQVGVSAIGGDTAMSGVPSFMEAGAAIMFESDATYAATDDFIVESTISSGASYNSDASILSLSGADAEGAIVERGAFGMFGTDGGKSESGVASRAVSGGLRSAGESSGGHRGASVKLESKGVLDADPFTDAYSVSAMGGTPHMSSIPGVLAMADMGDSHKISAEVKAPLASGERHRDNADQEQKEGNSDEWAELEQDEDDIDLIA